MDLTHRPFEESVGERDLAHWRTPIGRWLARTVLRISRWTTWTWTAIILAVVGTAIAFAGAYFALETYEQIHDNGGFVSLDHAALALVL